MKKVNKRLMFILLSVVPLSMQAKLMYINSENKFDRVIAQAPFGVALFYDGSRETKKDKALNKKTKKLLKTFKIASQQRDYADAHVLFAAVNVSKDDLEEVAQEHQLTEMPTMLLFKDEAVVKDTSTNKAASLKGFVPRADLMQFINASLGKEIRSKAQETRQQRAYNRWSWDVGFGYGYTYPWEYGWGGRWGYRRHYWW